MAPAQISTLLILLFSYWTIHIVAVHDRGPPFSHVQPGDVTCRDFEYDEEPNWTIKPLTEDCHAALQLIPSGRLTFEGGDPPTWSIDPPAQRRKLPPAAFVYKTCIIKIHLNSPPIRRPFESPARTMYYHVWPAAREDTERLLQQCIRAGRIGGTVTEKITFGGHGPFKLWVDIGPIQALEHSGPVQWSLIDPWYHVYDAAFGDAGRMTRKNIASEAQIRPTGKVRSWTKGCLVC
jgi:hypothetical protein